MKKLRRGAYFTDIHFGRKANSKEHNDDCLNFIKWFCANTKKEKCDYIAFLGDWNEQRNAINVQTLNASFQGARMLNNMGLPVYFVLGNHDLYHKNKREIHSVVHHDEFSNFTLVEHPTVINDIEGKVLFCPYLFHEEYKDLMKYTKLPFWAGHFEFKGFIITGYNVTMKTGPDASDFSGPKYIVSGHFHKRQSSENIVYIGNAFPMDFGDASDNDRGMMIYDHTEDIMTFYNWEDCPKYVTTTISELLDSDDITKILIPEANVKCVVDEPLEYNEQKELYDAFSKTSNIRAMKMEDSAKLHSLTDTEVDPELDKLRTIDEMILYLLGNIKDDQINNETLIKIYRGLKIDD